MLEQLAAVIAAAPGGEMEFSEFVDAAQQQRLRPELWLKAKHAGLISARIDADGRHILSVNADSAAAAAADEGAEA
jgi:hypothetical protein